MEGSKYKLIAGHQFIITEKKMNLGTIIITGNLISIIDIMSDAVVIMDGE